MCAGSAPPSGGSAARMAFSASTTSQPIRAYSTRDTLSKRLRSMALRVMPITARVVLVRNSIQPVLPPTTSRDMGI